MDNSSRDAIKSEWSNTRNTRSPPSRQRGGASGHIALPSHPAGRSSYTPSLPSPGAQPSVPEPLSEQSSSRREPTSFQIPAYPHEQAMSRYATPGPTTVSTSRPQQYQLVSPGTPADPRAMSQVSPGFIFVIFPLFAGVFIFFNRFPFPSFILRLSPLDILSLSPFSPFSPVPGLFPPATRTFRTLRDRPQTLKANR